uniref:Secreted protein n=1 Tax=Cacopsylla melanoneura TaxID=428564 RepID=A0A8D8TBQ7_9HEMI
MCFFFFFLWNFFLSLPPLVCQHTPSNPSKTCSLFFPGTFFFSSSFPDFHLIPSIHQGSYASGRKSGKWQKCQGKSEKRPNCQGKSRKFDEKRKMCTYFS